MFLRCFGLQQRPTNLLQEDCTQRNVQCFSLNDSYQGHLKSSDNDRNYISIQLLWSILILYGTHSFLRELHEVPSFHTVGISSCSQIFPNRSWSISLEVSISPLIASAGIMWAVSFFTLRVMGGFLILCFPQSFAVYLENVFNWCNTLLILIVCAHCCLYLVVNLYMMIICICVQLRIIHWSSIGQSPRSLL